MNDNSMFIIDAELPKYDSKVIGNKAHNLAHLVRIIPELVNVPKGIVLQTGNHITHFDIMSNIHTVEEYLHYPIIARSSSTVEDSSNSFAGLFDSFICNNQQNLIKSIEVIRQGGNSQCVLTYCQKMQIPPESIDVAVLMQEYKEADISGVLFTKHPIQDDNSVIYIEYSYQTSSAVTGGYKYPQSLVLRKDSGQQLQFPFSELYAIAKIAELNFGYALDVEWIVSNNKVWIVQIRKVTT